MTDANTPPTSGQDPADSRAASPAYPAVDPADYPEADTTPITPVPTKSTDAPASAALPRRRPLFPTILWGALMLALAAFIAARELVPGGLDLVTWLLTAVVGIGLLLVVAGIAAASRRAG